MQLSAFLASDTVRAVIGVKYYDCVVGNTASVDEIEHVAEAFVHAFDHRSIFGLSFVKPLVDIALIESVIALYGRMIGIVCEIQEKWYSLTQRMIEGPQCLACDGFGEMDSGTVVLRHIHH